MALLSAQEGSIPLQTPAQSKNSCLSRLNSGVVQNIVHPVPGSFQVPLDLSKYHLFTGLSFRLLQTTPLGKQSRTIALKIKSATPPLPCDLLRTANLSRYPYHSCSAFWRTVILDARRGFPSQQCTAFVFSSNDDSGDATINTLKVVLDVQLSTEGILD